MDNGAAFCAATVVHTWGSAPRPVGTLMFIGPNGEMLGSVSGGCVEGAVLRAAVDIQQNGGVQLLRFGVTDTDAWSVGLTCGGDIHILLERFPAFDAPDVWAAWREALLHNHDGVLATAMQAGTQRHFWVSTPDGYVTGAGEAPSGLKEAAVQAWRERKNKIVEMPDGQWFLRVFPRKAQLFIVGAAHVSAELVHLARYFDFETIVIDPRGFFAQNTIFHTPPDKIIEEYPAEVLPDYTLDEYAYAVVMAHDPKIDDQALHLLLRSRAAFIGALSSKVSNEHRRERLLNAGFSETDIRRIHAPVGLPIRSKTAKEIALSIMAQMIGVKNGSG
jgi:xanthine dehydrogenase accessory factor